MVRRDEVYFGSLGSALLAVGAIVFVRSVGLAPTGIPQTAGVVALSGAFFRGIILLSTGLLYLQAVTDGLDDRRNQAKAFLGSLMIWIIAGTQLLALVLGAIPGGPDVWVASASTIASSLSPPYPPSLYGAVLALVALTYTQFGGDGT